MTTVKWHEGRMAALDTETTGINIHEDRIVTAAMVHHAPGQRPRTIQWIINPGVIIPTEASDVHGWTNERLTGYLGTREAVRITNGQEQGMSREGALFEIAAQAATVMAAEAPLVLANAAYDLSLLETELTRHDIDTLSSRPTGVVGIVDPMVIDKQWDVYRKSCYKAPGCTQAVYESGVLVAEAHHECGGCRGGKHQCGGCGSTNRKLASLCTHYGVRLTSAHDAAADALGALRLTVKLAHLWPDIARLRLSTLHTKQVEWKRDQDKNLRDFWRRVGNEAWRDVCGEWPVHSACAPAVVGGAS